MHQEDGTEGCRRRQVLSCAEETRHVPNSVKIGYETSCSRHSRKPDPMRPTDKSLTGILTVERGTGGLLEGIPASGVGRDGVQTTRSHWSAGDHLRCDGSP